MIRIDVLPDDVLLEIFANYMQPSCLDKRGSEAWQSLVHVCRRWRNLISESPRRLDLQLFCTPETPTKDTLDVWPALPFIINGRVDSSSNKDNVIAALGHVNRVRQVDLYLGPWQLDGVLAAMHVSFPELTDLWLFAFNETPVIPVSFLGGSAPRLRSFTLTSIPFQGLSKQLLSATQLVELHLYRIPHSGYISPQAMVALLSMLSSLEKLHLKFESPQSRPDWQSQRLLPPKRSILPALNGFRFKGPTEYLEELTTCIDTPQLSQMDVTFFNQIDFDCLRLARFINRTPTIGPLDSVHVQLDDSTANVIFRSRTSNFQPGDLLIHISCREPDWQVSSVEQVCNSSLSLSMVEDLYIEDRYYQLVWTGNAVENTLWLQLFLPFTAVKNLYLSNKFAPGIAAALQALVSGGIIEVLPSLQNIFVDGLELSGSFQENIGLFVAARQLSNLPIAISDWERKALTLS